MPTRLGDNIVFENLKDHIWWFKYDDEFNSLLVSRKNQILEPFVTVSTAKNLEKIFRESLVMEIFWKDKIDFKIDENLQLRSETKINFTSLIKKYFSKKIRKFFSRS